MITLIKIPQTYEEAILSNKSDKQKTTMENKVILINKNKTYYRNPWKELKFQTANEFLQQKGY